MTHTVEAIAQRRREQDRRIDKAARRNGGEPLARSWQYWNEGSASISYCSMDSIIDTMNYTLAADRYE